MATVEKRRQERADGTSEVRYRVRWRDPSGKQRSKTFDRRRDADRWAATVEHSKNVGTYIDHQAGRITVKEYAEAWRTAKVWADSTGERTESALRLHVYPVLGDRPLGSIRPSDVQSWVKGLKLQPRSVAVVASNLSSVMRAAVRDRLIGSNPCDGIDLPRIDEREIVPPTPAQVKALSQSIAPQWMAAVAIGASLGMRTGEVLGLTVDRIDFLRRSVRVDRQCQRLANQAPKLIPLKTKASNRTIPMASSTSTILGAHVERFGVGGDGQLFHRQGELVRSQQFHAAIRSGVTAAGKTTEMNEAMRFHDLRHFYASMLIRQGCSVKTVQRRLGHASAVETLDTYGHLWPDDEEQTREAVEALVAPIFDESIVERMWPDRGLGSA